MVVSEFSTALYIWEAHDPSVVQNLEEKSHTKYLGVLIDKNLNWKAHIHHINLKLAKGLGMIAKIRHFVPSSIHRKLTMPFFILTLIMPFLIGVAQHLLTLSL